MIIPLRKWIERVKFILLFLVLTLLLNQLFTGIVQWMHPVQRYKDPAGKSLKVNSQDELPGDTETLEDRMIYFYWFGE